MIFDASLEGKLDFEDFLKMVLSQENKSLRFNAVVNPNYEVTDDQDLGEEIEYTLARFFWKITQYLERISNDKDIVLTLSQQNQVFFDSMKYSGNYAPRNIHGVMTRSAIPRQYSPSDYNGGVFRLIDHGSQSCLDFGNLARFFEKSNLTMRDTDLISILRLIDINDDGKIDEDEFNYFISIFKIVEPAAKLNELLNKRYGTK
jgi:hypothetical protein